MWLSSPFGLPYLSSYGYHGDDGNKFFNGENDSYGPTFSAGDIVGCGYNTVKQEIFFTKNGKVFHVCCFWSHSG